MMISHYGRKFLNKYNNINNKNLSPKEFFLSEMHSLFFENRTLMFVSINSPFSNPSQQIDYFIKQDFNNKNMVWGSTKNNKWFEKGEFLWGNIPENEKNYIKDNLSEYKKIKFITNINEFFKKINDNDVDSSMLIGGYAKDYTSRTSFNVPTKYKHNINEDEIYLSWIGNALAINLGGISFLFDNDEILYDIYLGWKRYDNLLNNPLYSDYPDSQINTWNAHWLLNKLSPYPVREFNPFSCCANSKKGLESISWIRFVFSLSNKYPFDINSYVYKLDKMNDTYGNITFELRKIGGFLNFCKESFGDNIYLKTPQAFEELFGTSYVVEKICSEFGLFGYEAIKPKLLKLEDNIFNTEKNKKEIAKQYMLLGGNEINYKLLKLYLMTKINLKDSNELVVNVAKTLHNILKCSDRNSQTHIEKFLNVRNQTSLLNEIDNLITICVSDELIDEANVLYDFNTIGIENNDKLKDLMLLIKINYNMIKIKQ
jgi:hypothetical protein